jgi:hypothetical protein
VFPPSRPRSTWSLALRRRSTGGFTLTVGPDEGQESYTFTGHATRPEAPTQVIQLNGRFDLRAPLNPPPLRQGIVTRYDAAGSTGLDWLLENRGSFHVVRNNGGVESYAIRTAEFLIDSDGLMVGEFRGVSFQRISSVIAPGTDLVVRVRGRVLGVCRVRLPGAGNTTGPDAVDPTNSRPRCAEMFAGFVGARADGHLFERWRVGGACEQHGEWARCRVALPRDRRSALGLCWRDDSRIGRRGRLRGRQRRRPTRFDVRRRGRHRVRNRGRLRRLSPTWRRVWERRVDLFARPVHRPVHGRTGLPTGVGPLCRVLATGCAGRALVYFRRVRARFAASPNDQRQLSAPDTQ